jgi:signal transduction histidine kinase
MSAPAATIDDAVAPVSAGELAEFASVLSSVVTRLQHTQETLRAEVRRLEVELSDSRRELKRARELAELGEMAAGIAHEIRNPLGSMKLYATMLIEDLADRATERETARKIAAGVDRVNEIVTDVLALARDLRIEPQLHTPRALVDAALAMCVQLVRDANVQVSVDPSLDAAPPIRCDGRLIQQAIANLVRNACQALAEWDERPADRGRLTIAIERRRVLMSDAKRQPMIVLSLADDGPGIEPRAIDRAFNPFYTTRETGTGLGLAIVHRILDAHGGWARVFPVVAEDGSPPLGTAAELLLPDPAATEPAPDQPETPAHPPAVNPSNG